MIFNGSTKKVTDLRLSRSLIPSAEDVELNERKEDFRHGEQRFSGFEQCFPSHPKAQALSVVTNRTEASRTTPVPARGPRTWMRHARPATSMGVPQLWRDVKSGYQTRGVGFRTAGTGSWRSSSERVVLALAPPADGFGQSSADQSAKYGDLLLLKANGTKEFLRRSPRRSPRWPPRPHTVAGTASRKIYSPASNDRGEKEKSGAGHDILLIVDDEECNLDVVDAGHAPENGSRLPILERSEAEEPSTQQMETKPPSTKPMEQDSGDSSKKYLELADIDTDEARARSRQSKPRPKSERPRSRPTSMSGNLGRAPVAQPVAWAGYGRGGIPDTVDPDLALPPALRHGRSEPAWVPTSHKRTESLLLYLHRGTPGFPFRPSSRQAMRSSSGSRFLSTEVMDAMGAGSMSATGSGMELHGSSRSGGRLTSSVRSLHSTGPSPKSGLSKLNPTVPQRLTREGMQRMTRSVLRDAGSLSQPPAPNPNDDPEGFGRAFATPDLSLNISDIGSDW